MSKIPIEKYFGIYYKFEFSFVKRKMTDKEICGKCSQRNDCRQVYQQISAYKGPSVLGKVLIAFAVPILSFVLAVAVFQYLAVKWINSRQLQVVFSLCLAVGITGLVVGITQVANRRLRKDRQN